MLQKVIAQEQKTNEKYDTLQQLAPGLYITSTPIGNLEDITLRALRILRSCHRIVCEDSRVSTKLLQAYNINKPIIVYHDRNADIVRPQIIACLQNNEAIALISDAGTPLIADPGFKLVQECYVLNIKMTTVPGPSALLSAAVLSGLPTHALTFLGFASNLHQQTMEQWRNVDTTLIFFESPHKLVRELNNLRNFFVNRRVVVLRELTKIHEEAVHGSFDELLEHFLNNEPRGEFVIALSPPVLQEALTLDADIISAVRMMSLRDACVFVATMRGITKKEVYRRALQIVCKDGCL